MKKIVDILPKLVLYILLAGCIITGLMFYLGGNEGTPIEVAGDFLDIPRFSDLFLNWGYILVALTVVITLIAVLSDYVRKFKANPKAALKSLIPICLFVAVFVIAWFLGSPEEVKIVGYEGTDNVGFWAQCTDMMMFSTYILLGVLLLVIVWGAIYVRIKK